ncbi:NAD(P)/FAD-dependent oxidoreductase [Candidatus Uabimicrobium amorphum]|uniref:Oxidoreductase n=1 Tax=Uabimicrobium amorphum TaxID=2596890 RepID=A0A5S9ITS1_UABAM|nr:FAD-dependent oxidoreductase [Candidatus Uabimicrobium amorphum]BBM87262.1 oxidoreductase [Candidatus Uabimicrobium amorphum]
MTYDLIIVGGGITGVSALYHMSQKKGIKTLLLEKNSQLGLGASGTWGFLTRVFHYRLEVTKLAQQAVDFHYHFKQHFGGDNHYIKTGSLYFLKKNMLDDYAQHFDFLEKNDVDFQILEAVEGKKRFPNFCWYEDDVVVFEPQGGLTGLGSSANYLASAACNNPNCEVRLQTPVEKLLYNDGQIEGVQLANGEILKSKVVALCLGPWGFSFLESIDEPMPFFPRIIQLNKFHRYRQNIKDPFFIDGSSSIFGHYLPSGSFIGGYLRKQSFREDVMPGKVSSIEANEAKHEIGKRITWIKNAALEGGISAIESYSPRGYGHVTWSSQIKNLLYTGGFSCTGYLLFPTNGREIADKVTKALN